MSDDLIKRSDVLSMIDAFERDFQQSWRVQFRANINAIPAVKDDRIEQLERERDEAMMTGHDLAKIEYRDLVSDLEAKLAKAMEALREIITRWDTPAWKDAEATGSVINRARTVLAELEGGE
jgi:hypothetical protein